MGECSGRPGGIESHLEAITATTLEWLQYEGPTEAELVGEVTGEAPTAPERPEAYDILMQLRRYGLSWAAGGYEDQPVLLMRELDAVCAAEAEIATIQAINVARRAEWAATHPPKRT